MPFRKYHHAFLFAFFMRAELPELNISPSRTARASKMVFSILAEGTEVNFLAEPERPINKLIRIANYNINMKSVKALIDLFQINEQLLPLMEPFPSTKRTAVVRFLTHTPSEPQDSIFNTTT